MLGFFTISFLGHNPFFVSSGKETKDLCQVSSVFVEQNKKLWVANGARCNSRVWKWF
jgi:hypothetical protein